MISAVQYVDERWIEQLTLYVARHDTARFFAYLGAEWLIWIFPLVLLLIWYTPGLHGKYHIGKKAVIMASLTVMIALAGKSLIGFLMNRPRPFVTYPELLHLNFFVDASSFPSGHTLIAGAIAFSLLYSGYRKLGAWLTVATVAIALSRVAAGVHYPSDVLASLLISGVVAAYLHREASSLRHYLPNEYPA